MTDIVSWLPHGMAFRIHKPKAFAEHVMPKYFNKTKYRSFQRQLQIYGFRRVKDKNSSENGAYYHKAFVRGQKSLCLQMTPSSSSQPVKHPSAAVPAPIEHTLEDEVVGSSSLGCGALDCNEEDYVSTSEWISVAQKIIAQVDHSNQETEQKAALLSCDHAGRRSSFVKSGGHRNSSIKDNEAGGNLSVADQQDLRDGDESFFAGRRFYALTEQGRPGILFSDC
jgi:hypothetical protein